MKVSNAMNKKITKAEANYFNGSPIEQCKDCSMFKPNSAACTLVIGQIMPKGHCDYFDRKNKLPVEK